LRRELDQELQFHLDMREEQRPPGDAPEQAALAARRQFGNVSVVKELSQEMWHFGSLDALIQDIRYGWRTMLRTPALSGVAILSLALGIGANPAVGGS
jgi:hypothetical protein